MCAVAFLIKRWELEKGLLRLHVFFTNRFAIRTFPVSGSCLFMFILNLFFAQLFFVSDSGFVLRLLLVYSVVLGLVSHFHV